MLSPRDVRLSMRLHGDTGFVLKNQQARLINCCIINVLDNKLNVDCEVVRMAGLEAGLFGLSGLSGSPIGPTRQTRQTSETGRGTCVRADE